MEITEYSSKYCPTCKRMASVVKKLKKSGIKINIIDCDKDNSKCKGIEYAPTIIIKKGNKSKKIQGFATAEEIKKEIKKIN